MSPRLRPPLATADAVLFDSIEESRGLHSTLDDSRNGIVYRKSGIPGISAVFDFGERGSFQRKKQEQKNEQKKRRLLLSKAPFITTGAAAFSAPQHLFAIYSYSACSSCQFEIRLSNVSNSDSG